MNKIMKLVNLIIMTCPLLMLSPDNEIAIDTSLAQSSISCAVAMVGFSALYPPLSVITMSIAIGFVTYSLAVTICVSFSELAPQHRILNLQ